MPYSMLAPALSILRSFGLVQQYTESKKSKLGGYKKSLVYKFNTHQYLLLMRPQRGYENLHAMRMTRYAVQAHLECMVRTVRTHVGVGSSAPHLWGTSAEAGCMDETQPYPMPF